MRNYKKAVLLVCILGLAGCATMPVATDFDNSRDYSKSKDQVWTNLVAFFATNNIQIKTIEKVSGVIYAERASFDETIADCGKDPLYPEVSRIVTLNVLVLPSGGGSTVTVTADYKANRVGPYYEQKTTRCLSTGKLERSILDAI